MPSQNRINDGHAGRILAAVSSIEGLAELKELADKSWQIVSTSGNEQAFMNFEIPFTPVRSLTGWNSLVNKEIEMYHRNILGSALIDHADVEKLDEAAEYGIGLIDIVLVNLPDFEKYPSRENMCPDKVAVLHAALANSEHVTVVTDPRDYDRVIQEILRNGETYPETRAELAIKASHHAWVHAYNMYNRRMAQTTIPASQSKKTFSWPGPPVE